jgi:hypothetical protein
VTIRKQKKTVKKGGAASLNTSYVLFNLREALEQIDKAIRDLESDPEYSDADLWVAMTHLYHHVNVAWNAGNSTVEESAKCSAEDFKKWSHYPADLEPLGVD